MIVTGLTAWIGELAIAGARAEVKARAAELQSGQDIVRDAQAIAPRLTGRFAESISMEQTKSGVEIGPTVDYGHIVEEGSVYRAPQPTMGPATDKNIASFLKRIEDAGDF
jgi:HK97 gp10 family phage protein